VPGYVEDELRGHLECGLLCFGFARALCTGCGQAFVVAFSCKGRGVCPSCNGRQMAQTAAYLVDHVIPPVPVRQWVISVPKRLRGFLADRPRAVAVLTKIFLAEIERLLLAAAGGSPDADIPRAARPRLGGISFLHRFGSALNHHAHLHPCVTDGVFVPAAAEAVSDAPPTFLPARPITHVHLAKITERVRRRVIRWFRLARLLDAAAAAQAPTSVSRGVCTQSQAAADRHGAGHWEHRQAGRYRDGRVCGRRTCGGRACDRRLLRRDLRDPKAPLPRYVADSMGEATASCLSRPGPAHRLG